MLKVLLVKLMLKQLGLEVGVVIDSLSFLKVYARMSLSILSIGKFDVMVIASSSY